MLSRLRIIRQEYPPQFWLLFLGLLVSTVGASMIWPFLMIYVSERLTLPLTTVASLLTINSIMGLIFSFIAGPVADRFGRKWVMVASLAYNGLYYLLMSRAGTLPAFAALMAFSGAFTPLYRVGADAMMADLIEPERRSYAYAILRMSNNLGVAVGPAIGGFVAASSYTTAFYIAAAGMLAYSLLLAVFARETLPVRSEPASRLRERFGGYGRILGDRPFVSFVSVFTLTQIGAFLLWILLSVYAKQNYGVSESQYGFIPATNAIMVVLFQVVVTRFTKRFPPLWVLAVGTLFYAVGVGSVTLGTGFWWFWTSMVITTVGELILIPTSTTYAANQAPPDMRGRYMSIYGLTWSIAAGIGPILGGFLNDNLGPHYIWYGGFATGMAATLGFIVLALSRQRLPQAQEEAVREV